MSGGRCALRCDVGAVGWIGKLRGGGGGPNSMG